MFKKYLVLIFGLGLIHSLAFAQVKDPYWLSLKRLSFSINAAYHFNPWHNYNNAVAKVVHQIRLDSFFHEPTGFYEKINGDAILRGGLGYQIFGGFNVSLTGQYGKTNSVFEFFPDSTRLPPDVTSVTHHQNMSFKIRSLGLALNYQIPINRKLALNSRVGVDRYAGQLKMSFRHTRAWRGPLPADEGFRVSAKMNEDTWGWNISAGLIWKLSQKISILTAIDYRNVEFSRLEGPAIFKTFEACPFTAELVEATNYFGLGVKEIKDPDCSVFLPALTFLTEPSQEARVPATVNLTSVGLRVGLMIGF